jgi:hypothetical protein
MQTYLHHLVQTYADVGDITIFAQGSIEEFEELFLPRIENLLHKKTGLLALGGTCSCACNGTACCTMEGTMIGLRDMFHLSTGRLCRGETFTVFGRGQFAVSRSRVHGRTREFYSMLMSGFTSDRGDSILDNHQFLGPGAQANWRTPEGQLKGDVWENNPLYGHTIERSWTLLFNCSDLRSFSCPCVSPQCMQTCAEGICKFAPTDCQCVDEG